MLYSEGGKGVTCFVIVCVCPIRCLQRYCSTFHLKADLLRKIATMCINQNIFYYILQLFSVFLASTCCHVYHDGRTILVWQRSNRLPIFAFLRVAAISCCIDLNKWYSEDAIFSEDAGRGSPARAATDNTCNKWTKWHFQSIRVGAILAPIVGLFCNNTSFDLFNCRQW